MSALHSLLSNSLVLAALSGIAAADDVCRAGVGHAGSCASSLMQTLVLVDKDASNFSEDSLTRADRCDEQTWPDRDHGLICSDCKVLVNRFSSFYKTCDGYCRHIGRTCVGAWEEKHDTCTVLHGMSCDQSIRSSDAICECSAEQSSDGGTCSGEYGQMDGVAADEGNGIDSPVYSRSSTECKRRCDASPGCKSFSLCRGWGKCWLKDKALTGSEPTSRDHDCQTYYKKCGSSPSEGTPSPAPFPSEGNPSPPPSPAGSGCSGSSCRSIKIMSYNTEYRNYNARMGGYAAKIKEVAPAIVGLQECQNRDGLARLSGYSANEETDRQNYILFDPSKVTLLSGGWMRIPRDDYAPRAITWGKFLLGEVEIWFFNTHLPHNHNEASSKTTHAKIAGMLLDKRRELGIENAPTIVVGDMNSHASDFNRVHTGGFNSNLQNNGFVLAYTAQGHPGYGGIDHILYSSAHWSHSGCSDTGRGGSDHTSITCTLELQ